MTHRFLATHEVGVPAHLFRWRDQTGQFHKPEDMETRHLFHTIRMIWNHSMPVEARLNPFKAHRFGSFYSRSYMVTAVRLLLPVLLDRRDIQPEWRVQLAFMAWFLRENEVALPPKVYELSYEARA